MPSVRKEVIAILCADLHLSLNAPIWRSAEPDWFAAMKRPLNQLKELQKKYHCSILCAGDIFDKWNSPPELCNFAIENLPNDMYCIPGQHDLPLHNYEDVKKSAYHNLVLSKKIIPMYENHGNMFFHYDGDARAIVSGYNYGDKIEKTSCEKRNPEKDISIAVLHEYKWIKGHNYTSAPNESKLGKRIAGVDKHNKWFGYDVIVYGDNHKGFHTKIGKTTIFNCGSLMRRNSDQIDYQPQVGLLYDDGSIEPYALDISEDKHLAISQGLLSDDSLNMKSFIEELEKLDSTDLDFQEVMEQYLKKNKIKKPIRNIILKAMKL